ncbi:MAG TPA: glycosyltransferase family 2 protein [Myxococcota bacterium]|nr:glycosyltransferase family 2 protein [Myxococcota bacterium]
MVATSCTRPDSPGAARPELSIVVPARDEEESLDLLHRRVCAALDGRIDWELVIVDDGSRDATAEGIAKLAGRDPRVHGARLARRSGQTSAIFAGADLARGALIATLDADLQNDPADLIRLVEALGDDAAVVGYRISRRDGLVRSAASWIANRIRDLVSGDRVRDTGCSLKLFRAEALRGLPRFEGMHRFLPTLLRYQGLHVRELPVAHHPRLFGRSKYGIFDRAFRGLSDLLAVRWMRSRLLRTGDIQRIGCPECEGWQD